MDYLKVFDECNQDLDLFIEKVFDYYDEQDAKLKDLGERKGYRHSLYECLQMNDMQEAKKKYNSAKSISLAKALSVFKDELPMMIKVSDAFGEGEKWNDVKERLKRSDEEFDRQLDLAKSVRMESVLRDNGIVITRDRCKCPLCESSNPTTFSFRDNKYYCFKCDRKGDSINFVQEYLKLNFKESINYLKNL